MSKKDITQNMLNCLAEYANNVRRDLTSACANALKAGAYLNHIRTTNNIPMTDALSRIGLSRATAYRWMDAHNTACKILELQATPSVLDADFAGHLAALDDIAKGMSLSRLALGAPAPSSDIARLDILQTGAETAETEQEEELYKQAVENVESGKWTLIQAMRAVGGKAAQDIAIERRKDPVYIEIDEESKKPVGILPKAITSLKTGLQNWNVFDGEAKRVFAQLFKEVLSDLPEELKKYL